MARTREPMGIIIGHILDSIDEIKVQFAPTNRFYIPTERIINNDIRSYLEQIRQGHGMIIKLWIKINPTQHSPYHIVSKF